MFIHVLDILHITIYVQSEIFYHLYVFLFATMQLLPELFGVQPGPHHVYSVCTLHVATGSEISTSESFSCYG